MPENDTDQALRRLRTQVAQLDKENRAHNADLRFTAMTIALAVAMLAMTTTTWFHDRTDYEAPAVARTAWDLPDLAGWFGVVTLLLVLGVAVATVVQARLAEPTRAAHWTLSVVSAACGGCVLFMPAMTEDHVTAAPALWLTMAAALTLTATQGTHGDVLSARARSV